MSKWPWILGMVLIVGSFFGGYYLSDKKCQEQLCQMPSVTKMFNTIKKSQDAQALDTSAGADPKDLVALQDTLNQLNSKFSWTKFSVCHRFDLGIYSSAPVANSPVASDLKPRITLGYTPLAYGRDKEKNDYRFLRIGIGAGVDKKVDLLFAPVMMSLNRGHKSPWVGNTFLTPYLGTNLNSGNFILGLGLNLSF